MKLFIKALVNGTVAAVLLVASTGMAHADKGGSGGGSRGGSSGGSARMGSSNAGNSVKMGQGSGQQINKGGNINSVNKTNVAQNQQTQAKKVDVNKGNINVAKNTNVQQQNFNKPQQQNFKSNFYCGTPWKGNCFPSYWNCGYGFGYGFGWNSCFFPWYRSHCYTPCYDYCSYPVYDYCCTTPVVFTYQTPIVVTTKLIEIVQQPAPVVETVTSTTTTASAAVVKPPAHDVSFLTGSATNR